MLLSTEKQLKEPGASSVPAPPAQGVPPAAQTLAAPAPAPHPRARIFHKVEPAGSRCAAGSAGGGGCRAGGVAVSLSGCPDAWWAVCPSVRPSPRRCLDSSAEQAGWLSIWLSPGWCQERAGKWLLCLVSLCSASSVGPAAGPCVCTHVCTRVCASVSRTDEPPPAGPDGSAGDGSKDAASQCQTQPLTTGNTSQNREAPEPAQQHFLLRFSTDPRGTQQQCILRAQPRSLLVPGWPHTAASSSAQGREAAKRGTALAASWLAVPKMWVMTGPAAMLAGDGEGVFVEGRPRFTDIRGAAGQAEPRGTVSHSFYQGNLRKIFHPGRYSRISTSKSLPDVF